MVELRNGGRKMIIQESNWHFKINTPDLDSVSYHRGGADPIGGSVCLRFFDLKSTFLKKS